MGHRGASSDGARAREPSTPSPGPQPSEEVVGAPRGEVWHLAELRGRRLKGLEAGLEAALELEGGGHVAAPVAVVGRGPHGDEALVEHPLVALHDELVGPGNLAEVVGVQELLHNVAA
eukprot:CAMPEP_0206002310 /NCGR_PEP_ID=MMETSP1464-20131121/2663_1 /ASSEMBLY_ACC=CAM_ASM_001124 /TAXON_ID=119497 /ORGANISM="Exanthemachrysis gayraliae, Strain RCC1523" /LENGTH=117 /DNA_ID=CAMNT_0053375647 /DNA_START=344 /DNA_END=694 /DNA_ORIENTATION=+